MKVCHNSLDKSSSILALWELTREVTTATPKEPPQFLEPTHNLVIKFQVGSLVKFGIFGNCRGVLPDLVV